MRRIQIKYLTLLLLLVAASLISAGQTQDDFNKKLSDIYINASDKKKALTLAKELYNSVESKKDLQTYANYVILKNIFENQAPDATLAKNCEEKATKLMNAMVGIAPETPKDTATNPMNRWYYVLYPGLFSTKDPQNASKALDFVNATPSLQTYDSYYYIAYAFERNGDFTSAKKYYETAMYSLAPDDNNYHSFAYYSIFLSKTGEYLKADEYIRKMERLAESGNEMLRVAYRSEALSARVVYYLNIGDYESYIKAAAQQVDYASEAWHKSNVPCDPYPGIRLTNSAYAKEMMKEYDAAEKLWKSRDSINYIWVNCHNQTYPNDKYYPVSMYPVYLIKRGHASKLTKPLSFYIKETEDHYKSYSQYADLSVNFMKATQFGFLGSPDYPALFKPLMQQVRSLRNFRESTQPFTNYAYFSMKDRRYDEAVKTYTELFSLNADWINDVIFTFGEKAFATYYNARLKEGYENFHSFVRVAKEKQPALFPQLAGQAYNNLLFTKSISLKGTERRKEAFVNANDPAIVKMYEKWLEKKQQLIRQYLKADDPSQTDTSAGGGESFLNQLQNEVNTLENELTIKSNDFKKYLRITPPDWKTIRDKLKEGEAAIEMVRFQWRDQVFYSDTSFYAAYIITKSSQYPDVVYLPDTPGDLENKYFKNYKNSIRLRVEDNESYGHFWKPIVEKLGAVKKVYFSPDGIYHLLNIATLKNPVTGKYVVDEIEVQYTTSGVDIANTSASINSKTAVLIGRPAYKTGTVAPVAVANPATRSLVNGFRENTIPDLPGTEEEILSIKKEMDQKNMSVSTWLKEQATEDKLYTIKKPGILHIATHGYWSPAGENATAGYRSFNAMVNSGLLLTGVVNYYSTGNYPDTYDGILTAYEAQNLDLENTSLVVLSACETSLGFLDAGEGVYGLQRAFRAAGAQSIMTSLWKVDDVATKDFMVHFYQEYLQTKDKNAAFISAQKFTKEKYKHPYFWGAFVMTGE